MTRHRSVDSSSSSSDSEFEDHHGHKEKKDKKHKKDTDREGGYHSGHGQTSHGSNSSQVGGHLPMPFPGEAPSFLGGVVASHIPFHGDSRDHVTAPPPYQPRPTPPPSGYRIPLTYNSTFPPLKDIGHPVCYEPDGVTPLFIGSALMDRSVHPCKIGSHLGGACIAYGGSETGHSGRYDLLPFVPEQMEWVRTSHGKIPPGRRPIEGGYEEGGQKLYHAIASVNGIRVPGKTGEHLEGANAGFGGNEYVVRENYEILCWK